MDGPVSTTQNGASVIGLRGAGKTYATGRGELVAVAPTTLDIAEGEFFGIIGFSGAGKSTLLRLINRLEDPTEGQVLVDGVDLTRLDKRSLRAARRSTGMIFQQFNLLSNRTTVGNVEFPLEVAGVPRAERRGRAMAALELVGLADKASEHPARLSGGQKQRVGIARALVNDPKVLLCDEPTSALDPHTTLALLKSLKRIREDLGVTIVIVTHEINVVRYVCDRVAIMDSGRVVELLDMHATDIEPRSGLGRFLFATADGYRDDIDPYVGEEEG